MNLGTESCSVRFRILFRPRRAHGQYATVRQWSLSYCWQLGTRQPDPDQRDRHMASVNDVAAYILKKGGRMSTMKLQKLAYYSQAWHLVWDEEPLFPEPIQAWVNGPVVRALYDQHKGYFNVSQWPTGDIKNLTLSEKQTIATVLETYGKYSGQQLSELSHEEGPWRETRKDLPDGWGSSREIPQDLIQAYYSAVASDEDARDI